jgi:hypothetical protein
MVYNDTPIPTDTPATSQPQMRQNFQTIASFYNVDHVPLSSGSNVGFHKQVTLQNAFNTPGPGGDPGQVSPITSIYTKNIAGVLQLFFQNGALAANVAQLTGLPFANLVNAGTAGGSLYQLNTPWGFIIYFGTTGAFTGPGKTITLPTGIATAVAVSSANTGAGNIISTINPTSPTNVNVGTNNLASVNWFIIGHV